MQKLLIQDRYETVVYFGDCTNDDSRSTSKSREDKRNCHNAQNQNIKSEKGLQKEICFNHFIFEGIGIFLTGSKPLPSVFGVLAADKGRFEL